MAEPSSFEHDVRIDLEDISLPGILSIPVNACGIVIFSHGSGSSRLSPRNTYVAHKLQRGGVGTLLFDLLTPEEDLDYERRFDIPFLTQRLVGATHWLTNRQEAAKKTIGYFGASTGAASALFAAADVGKLVRAVVSRGGRPDLAMDVLPRVHVPTLLIVGGDDEPVLSLNRDAYEQLPGIKQLAVVPGATHLFEEPGTLEEVARLATDWFKQYLCITTEER